MQHQYLRASGQSRAVDGELEEEQEWAGVIKVKDMLHRLSMLRDESSGAVRLEACALRGPMKELSLIHI